MALAGVHTVTVGDTGDPLDVVLRDKNGNPYNLALYTVKAKMELENGTEELAPTSTGVTVHPTQIFTAEADDDYLTCVGHGLAVGDQIVLANSGGALPSGLLSATRYWPTQITSNRFQLSAYPGGPSLPLASDGSGTNTFYVVGSVRYAFASGNVDTAQNLRLWFVLSDTLTEPKGDSWFEIRVVNAGN